MGFTVNAAERISINKDGKVSFGSNAENKLHFEESGVTHWLIYPYDHTNSHYPSLYRHQTTMTNHLFQELQ